MANGRPAVLKLLQDLLTNTRSWEPHTRDVLKLSLETLELQYLHLKAQEETISALRVQLTLIQQQQAELNERIVGLLKGDNEETT